MKPLVFAVTTAIGLTIAAPKPSPAQTVPAAANAQTAPTPSEPPAFTLQLSVLNAETHRVEEETVTVDIKNVSDHEIYVAPGPPNAPGPPVQLEVLDQHGAVVKETAQGMKAHGTDPKHQGGFIGSVFAVPVRSGNLIYVDHRIGQGI